MCWQSTFIIPSVTVLQLYIQTIYSSLLENYHVTSAQTMIPCYGGTTSYSKEVGVNLIFGVLKTTAQSTRTHNITEYLDLQCTVNK